MSKKIEAVQKGTKVIIPCRLSYVHLDAPWAKDEKNTKKYSVCCIVSKDDTKTVEVINNAIAEAKKNGVVSKWEGKVPKPAQLKEIIHDGDAEKDEPEYQNAIFFNASNLTAVPILNRLKEEILPTAIYSGCYGVVSVTFFPYASGSKGIGAGLNAVVKTDDGEKLASGPDARKDFDDMDFGADEGLDSL